MFSNLRYFAVISLVLVVVGATSLSLYFRQIKQAEMLEYSAQQAQATIASFTASVWNRYASDIIPNPNSPNFSTFQLEAQRFFAKQPIAKITLFSPNVTRLYFGSTPAYATSDGTTRITLFDLPLAQKGQPSWRLLKNSYLTGGADASSKRAFIQLIIPINPQGAGMPQALAEVYLDVSSQWRQLEFFQYLIVGTMIGLFTVLIGVMMVTAKRAESIITKQHEVNLELTAAAAQAEAQSRDKSQFLASVSHELRTPLNAIIGFSEIIKNETRDKLDKVYQDYLEDIYASGKHLLSLINDILDFSKAEAGKLQIEWAETDATKIIGNSLRMVLPRAETAQVTLVEDLPSHHLVIVTDAKKLKQVLLNLLSNAVKFTPAGGEVRCQAWNDVVTGALSIQVSDTGIGIAPKDISRVMTPFGQVDSALSRKYEGTGLGLPIASKFIESMGGKFTIESELNVGTKITITLPKAPPNWDVSQLASNTHTEEQPNVAPSANGDQAA